MARGDLNEVTRVRLGPLLPACGRRGGQWRDRPEPFGPGDRVHDRFARRRRDGTWDRLLALAQSAAADAGELAWTGCIDGLVVRAHRHAAGARRSGAARPTVPRASPIRRASCSGAVAADPRRRRTSPATSAGGSLPSC